MNFKNSRSFTKFVEDNSGEPFKKIIEKKILVLEKLLIGGVSKESPEECFREFQKTFYWNLLKIFR